MGPGQRSQGQRERRLRSRPRLSLGDQRGQPCVELHPGREQQHVALERRQAEGHHHPVEGRGPGRGGQVGGWLTGEVCLEVRRQPGQVLDEPGPGLLGSRRRVDGGGGDDVRAHAGTSTVCVDSKTGSGPPWSTRWLSAPSIAHPQPLRALGHRAAVEGELVGGGGAWLGDARWVPRARPRLLAGPHLRVHVEHHGDRPRGRPRHRRRRREHGLRCEHHRGDVGVAVDGLTGPAQPDRDRPDARGPGLVGAAPVGRVTSRPVGSSSSGTATSIGAASSAWPKRTRTAVPSRCAPVRSQDVAEQRRRLQVGRHDGAGTVGSGGPRSGCTTTPCSVWVAGSTRPRLSTGRALAGGLGRLDQHHRGDVGGGRSVVAPAWPTTAATSPRCPAAPGSP